MSENYQSKSSWMRILFVVLFWIVFYVTQFVLAAVVVAQCAFTLFTGNTNHNLLKFGDMLSKYVHDILRYVTFNTDQRPFPFDEFPKSDLVIPQAES